MKAIFYDRDGVINPLIEREGEKISPQNVEQFEFLPGAEKSLRKAEDAGYLNIVFTNQPDVGKSWRSLDKEKLGEINEILKSAGVNAVYACTHGPLGGRENKHYRENGEIVVCGCRKPQPGLLEKAVRGKEIDFSESYVIGDSESDLKAAERFEEKHNVSFAGKFKIGEEKGAGDRTFDNVYSSIEFIVDRV